MPTLSREAMITPSPPTEAMPGLVPGVVPTEDWQEQLDVANEASRLIDRHLNFEARYRKLRNLFDFRPAHLCPEQRVQLLTDLSGVVLRPGRSSPACARLFEV